MCATSTDMSCMPGERVCVRERERERERWRERTKERVGGGGIASEKEREEVHMHGLQPREGVCERESVSGTPFVTASLGTDCAAHIHGRTFPN